jgi:hypothetical protein
MKINETKQGLPSSKLGEEPQILEKHGCRPFRQLYEGRRNADTFQPGGYECFFPPEENFTDPLAKILR